MGGDSSKEDGSDALFDQATGADSAKVSLRENKARVPLPLEDASFREVPGRKGTSSGSRVSSCPSCESSKAGVGVGGASGTGGGAGDQSDISASSLKTLAGENVSVCDGKDRYSS